MSIASGVRKRIDQLFHERPPEPRILYGPYDAIWPTIGVGTFGWFCLSCGRNDGDYPTLPDSRLGAEDHSRTHTDVNLRLVEVEPDPDEIR